MPRFVTRCSRGAACVLALVLVWLLGAAARPASAQTVNRDDITYILPYWFPFSGASSSTVAAELADMRARLGPEGPYVRLGFAVYVFVSMDDWNVDVDDPAAVRASLSGTIRQIDNHIAKARAANAPIAFSIITAIRERYDPVQTASEAEDVRSMQWFATNEVARGWWTFSRYARKQQRVQEAYVRELGKVLANRMRLYPDILVASAGDGEQELPFGIGARGDIYADYSPFTVAEFRDWIRLGGLYAPGQPFDGQGYTGGARYRGDLSPAHDTNGDGHTLNGDFGTAFTTWDLLHFNWSLEDAWQTGDPGAIPLAAYSAPGFQRLPGSIPGGFDPPRVPQYGAVSPWWGLWVLFKQTLVQRHNIEFAKWITTSADPDTGATVPPERWYSYQIPADYLFNGTPETPNERWYSSMSSWWTADVSPYGSMAFTAFNVDFGTWEAITLPNVAPRIAERDRRWGIIEWNPGVTYPTSGQSPKTALYDAEMAVIERYRPTLLQPWVWDDPDFWNPCCGIKDTEFETALRGLIARIRDGLPPDPRVSVETPVAGANLTAPFVVSGWAADLGKIRGPGRGPGIDRVDVYAVPVAANGRAAEPDSLAAADGRAADAMLVVRGPAVADGTVAAGRGAAADGARIHLGTAIYGANRPDVAAAFGSQFGPSGFSLTIPALPTGHYELVVAAHSTVTLTTNEVSIGTVVVGSPTQAAPVVTLHPASQSVQAGAVATFTAAASGTPAPTVRWQVSTDGGATWADISGATAVSYAFTTAQADHGTRFRAVFTNTAGSAPTNPALLTVTAATSAPVVTTHPASQSVQAGAVATFTAAATGTPAPTVRWQRSADGGAIWTDIPGATSASYAFTTAQADHGTRFRAVFTNTAGSAATNAAVLTVTTAAHAPVVTAHPVSQSVQAGAVATFTAAATGTPAPTVRWQRSADGGATWTDVPGATSASYAFTTAQADHGTRFRAVFTNTAGSAATNAALLTVTTAGPSAPVVTIHPVSQSVTSGTRVELTAAATGTPTPTVEWHVRRSMVWYVVEGASSPTYGFVATAADNGRQFRAVFTNPSGAAVTATATITVTAPPAGAPVVVTHPSSQTVRAGTQVTFSSTATGTPTPSVRWQLSADGGTTWIDASGATATSFTLTAAVVHDGTLVRAVFTNTSGSTNSDAAALRVYGPVGAQPASLQFTGSRTAADGVLQFSPAQAVTVSFTGAPSAWTAAADQPWIQITGGSGSAASVFTVGIVNPGGVIGSSMALDGSVTITAPDSANGTVIIPVTLTIDQGAPLAAPPFGLVDTPIQGASNLAGSVAITGWALDDASVAGVAIYRNCLGFEPPSNCRFEPSIGTNAVFIGDATFVAGMRPDVERLYPTYPHADRAGWGYLMLTNMLPHIPQGQMFGGEGTFVLYAVATDADGHQSVLGRELLTPTSSNSVPTTVTLANDGIARPFGAIDLPTQGATVSGRTATWGWALTPDTNTTAGADDILVPVDGTTLQVLVDGVPWPGRVLYNLCRGNPATGGVQGVVPPTSYCDDDVANVFGNLVPQPSFTPRSSNPTRYRNLDLGRGSVGAQVLDTTTLGDGLHTIMWGVRDSQGRVDGIGSRFFWVLNTGADARPGTGNRGPGTSSDSVSRRDITGPRSPIPGPRTPAEVFGRTGLSLDAPFVELLPDADGIRHVQLAPLDRLELQFTGSGRAGYLVANGEYRPLPAGSRLDAKTGTFTWVPGPGFVGTYRLAFGRALSPKAPDAEALNAPTAGGLEGPSTPSSGAFGERARPYDARDLEWGRGTSLTDPRSPVPGPGEDLVLVDVTIRPVTPPAPGEAQLHMSLDLPQPGATLSGAFVVAGWALDPAAGLGSGIGTIHVWAQPLDRPGATPLFLGVAQPGEASPDPAAVYGPPFSHAGFTLTVDPTVLPPGAYALTAYAWNLRTTRWEDARRVTVSVR